MMFRARKKSARDVSLYEPIGTDREGNEISLLDVMEYAEIEIPEKIDPVSYTHLDVYKRQMLGLSITSIITAQMTGGG